MRIQDLIDYLGAYAKDKNQLNNLDDFYVEVNGETNTGLLVKNNTGDSVDSVDLVDS